MLLARLWGNLGEPDNGFHRFNLAKEGADIVELVVPPMLKQTSRLGSYLPLVRIRPRPPKVDLMTNFIDINGFAIFLFAFGFHTKETRHFKKTVSCAKCRDFGILPEWPLPQGIPQRTPRFLPTFRDLTISSGPDANPLLSGGSLRKFGTAAL